MRPFQFVRADDLRDALRAFASDSDDIAALNTPPQYLAGATTVIVLLRVAVAAGTRSESQDRCGSHR